MAPPDPAIDGPTHRPVLYSAVAVIAVAAGLMLLLANRAWLTVHVARQPPFGPLTLGIPGRHLYAALPGMAVVALLIAVLLLITGGWARSVLALLLLVTGVWTAVNAAQFLAGRHFDAAALAGDRAGLGGHTETLSRHPVWAVFSLVCSALLAGVAGLVLVRARSWPGGLPRRYAAPSEAAAAPDPWRQLDRGEDPTIGSG